jgi:hypothetical protein
LLLTVGPGDTKENAWFHWIKIKRGGRTHTDEHGRVNCSLRLIKSRIQESAPPPVFDRFEPKPDFGKMKSDKRSQKPETGNWKPFQALARASGKKIVSGWALTAKFIMAENGPSTARRRP